jgi:hypothetical protein
VALGASARTPEAFGTGLTVTVHALPSGRGAAVEVPDAPAAPADARAAAAVSSPMANRPTLAARSSPAAEPRAAAPIGGTGQASLALLAAAGSTAGAPAWAGSQPQAPAATAGAEVPRAGSDGVATPAGAAVHAGGEGPGLPAQDAAQPDPTTWPGGQAAEPGGVLLASADAAPTSADAAPAAPPPPTYPTKIPPAARLAYTLQRGVISGSAELDWAPAAGRYELRLAGSVFGADVMDWHSSGLLDANGLAPVRFADKRRGRERQVANFQRQAGRITFSGPQVSYPLVPGAQDRLSFMLQLAAIVNADPARYRPGTRLQMFVAGARGDGSVWTFLVGDRETLELPAGRVTGAVSLRRVTRAEHDTQSEVWLDPARQHLPVRLVMTSGSQSLDLALR